MKKTMLFILLYSSMGCSRNFDHAQVYKIVQEKFPHDCFIEQAIEKAKKAPEIFEEIPEPYFFQPDFPIPEPFKIDYYPYNPFEESLNEKE